MKTIHTTAFAFMLIAGFNLSINLMAQSIVEGVWKGESICATGAPGCRNESVVYYIKSVPDKPKAMFVQADKVVGGKAITMGSGEWEYDDAAKVLMWRLERQTWRLKIEQKQIDGTLTLSDGTVFRKMTLKKDQ